MEKVVVSMESETHLIEKKKRCPVEKCLAENCIV
jgi:hypothetical protein